MNMNKLISVTEYFKLIEKAETNPAEFTNEDQMKVNQFENFITTAIQYEDTASEALKSVIAMYREHIRVLYSTGKENLANQIEEKLAVRLPEQENTRKLSLPQAGYVSSSIIVVVLLNIGFIIALAILGSR